VAQRARSTSSEKYRRSAILQRTRRAAIKRKVVQLLLLLMHKLVPAAQPKSHLSLTRLIANIIIILAITHVSMHIRLLSVLQSNTPT